MKYKIWVTEEAKEEIIAAKLWYEKQQPGLGLDFISAIKYHINSLKTDVAEHKPVYDNIRRILVKRFPYVIYYSRDAKERTVKVYAVLHDKQDRRSLRERL
ncbi:MAG TPA: type II toxin-antitoxin system RelE/ParE family toxin [Chitinophagales bacterium]|nr:type II toxin-antitoxin system RelE/ParE family toxin [Chitinophagales bacterium]